MLYTYKIRIYECTPSGILAFPQLLNLLQETASVHAAECGFDFPLIDPADGTRGAWVLAQLHVRMTRYPKAHEEIRIETHPYGVHGLFALRDFIITFADGSPCGFGVSRWMMLDPRTRRPVRIPAEVTTFDAPHPELFPESETFSRLRYPANPDEKPVGQYRTLHSNIDPNGHVNNVFYVSWMLEDMPRELLETHQIRDFEINFRTETLYGETISCFLQKTEPETYLHRVSSATGSDHIIASTTWVPQPR